MLWLVFFLHGMSAGTWLPSLINVLMAQHCQSWIATVFAVQPICSLISPLIGGALADQRIPADRLFAWSSILSSVGLIMAFASLTHQVHPMVFITILGLNALISSPQWSLLATVSLTNLSHGESQYPKVRVGATIGWIAGGLIASYGLQQDSSPTIGYTAAAIKLLAGLTAFYLPHTPPLGRVTNWKNSLGLEAFAILKNRNTCVFILVTGLFCIPLTAFYMFGPEFLKALGDKHPTGTMTVAQILEIISMLIIGSVMTRYRIKTVLLWALGGSVLRFALSGISGLTGDLSWHIMGIALHGACYTFYFITAQVFLDRRVDPSLKGQAQGLLTMMSSGIGPLIGAYVCDALRKSFTAENLPAWSSFWFTLATMIACCFTLFAIFYKSTPTTPNSDLPT